MRLAAKASVKGRLMFNLIGQHRTALVQLSNSPNSLSKMHTYPSQEFFPLLVCLDTVKIELLGYAYAITGRVFLVQCSAITVSL